MSRHSKNCTANAIFTYWERKKVTDAGTLKARLGSDDMWRFEDCWLCLKPANDPVCTPKGYIYCRQCIILNFGEQKKEQGRAKRIYDEFQCMQRAQAEQLRTERNVESTRAFVERETACSTDTDERTTNGSKLNESAKRRRTTNSATTTISGLQDAPEMVVAPEKVKAERRKNNFWIPENTPTAKAIEPLPPKKHLQCPISGVDLRLKDLITLKPDVIQEAANAVAANSGKSTRWICPYARKVINHQEAAVVLPTSQVVLMECAKKFILGEHKSGKEVFKPSDIVLLQSGGTGYSTHSKVESQVYRPVLE
eukprot:Lankesteria_metandrocarpae@DN7551_c0_g1_i1.p1